MNKTYRSVWSEQTGTWVAASEMARSRGRGSRSVRSAVALGVLLLCGPAFAQSGIGTPSPDPSSWLTIGPPPGPGVPNRGVLMPRVASGDATTWGLAAPTPVDGMVVYNTTAGTSANGLMAGLMTWKAGKWVSVDETPYLHVNSTAVGNSTQANSGATGADAIAIGRDAVAATTNSLALGQGATVNAPATVTAINSGTSGIAIGQGATVTGGSDTYPNMAIGYQAKAVGGVSATAVGGRANAAGTDSVAFGVDAMASGPQSTALGRSAVASEVAATAVGRSATATANRATALGYSADATNNRSTAIGSDSTASGAYATTLGVQSTASGTASFAQGYLSNASQTAAIAIGYAAKASAADAIALGRGAQASGVGSISIGTGNVVSGNNSGAIGDPSVIDGANSYSVGNNNTIGAGADNTFVLGNNVNIGKNISGAVALGDGSGVTQAGGVALGSKSQATTAAGVVGYDPGTGAAALAGTAIASTTSTLAAVSVGGNGQYRQITNVAAGAADSDAVNVSQLKAVSTAAAAGAVHYYSVKSSDQSAGSNYANDGATGLGALAAGAGARAAGQGAVAVGANANAAGLSSLAVGNGAVAGEASTVAIGSGATAKGAFTTAIGTNAGNGSTTSNGVMIGDGAGANSSGDHNAYIGSGAGFQASGSNNSAFGAVAGSAVTGNGNTAFGFAAGEFVTGDANIAFGNVAAWQVNGNRNTAIGTYAGFVTTGNDNYASGSYAGIGTSGSNNVAIGTSAGTGYSVDPATGDFRDRNGNVVTSAPAAAISDTVAIGNKAIADADRTVVLGANAQATVADGVAIGSKSVASTAAGIAGYDPSTGTASTNTTPVWQSTAAGVSVGDVANGITRQINGVAAGTNATDAVNVAQLQAVAGQAVAASNKWITGSQTTTYVAPTASGGESTAVGSGAIVNANNSVAVGTGAKATTDNSVALGNGSTTTAATPTASTTIQGQTYNFAGANPAGVVSVGAPGAERQIQNVAAGQLNATSTDAVNGSQLYATNQAINNIQTGGGGIKYFHANSQAADSQAAGAESVAIGPQAIALGASSFAGGSGAQANGAGSIALGANAISTSSNGVALGNGASADRAGMNGQKEMFSNVSVLSAQGAASVGSAGNERQITNVAGGTQATDAVNVRQLQAVKNSSVQYDTNVDGTVNHNSITLGNNTGPTTIHNVAPGVAPTDAANVQQLNQQGAAGTAYTDARTNALGSEIRNVARNAYAGVAAAMAVQMPGTYVPGKTVMRIGYGVFKGESAVGVSFRRTSESNAWSLTGGVGMSRAGAAATVGAEWVFN